MTRTGEEKAMDAVKRAGLVREIEDRIADLERITTKKVVCYGYVKGQGWTQEWYETKSRDAGRRAADLRLLGFRVRVSSMGTQVTKVGLVALTLVTVFSDENLPLVQIE